MGPVVPYSVVISGARVAVVLLVHAGSTCLAGKEPEFRKNGVQVNAEQ